MSSGQGLASTTITPLATDEPADAGVLPLVERLAAAKRPIVLGGRGVLWSGAREAVIKLADRCGALLSNTLPARGLFHDHPFGLGVTGSYFSSIGKEMYESDDIVRYLFQQYGKSLLPWRTTLANVMLPLEIVEPWRSSFRQKRDEYEQKARKLLQSVGLGGYEDKFPWQLSGGMQQRASICRALIHEPKMLLLDEPFGALDAFTREELWCALRDLQAQQKFNVILVTHDLRESVFLADTVYVMSKSPGRFVVRREIDLPRPRDLEVTYTSEFTAIVHELRGHIGAIRGQAAGVAP